MTENNHCSSANPAYWTGQSNVSFVSRSVRATPINEVGRAQTDAEINPNTLNNLADRIYAWCHRKGWRGEGSPSKTFGDDIALIVSEVSEALEAFREGGDARLRWYSYDVEIEQENGPVKFKGVTRAQLAVLLETNDDNELDLAIEDLGLTPKPEGVGSELADAIIRILDTAHHYGIDIEAEVLEKMSYNETREFRHGGKAI